MRAAKFEEIDGVKVALFIFISYGLLEVGTNELKAVSFYSPPGWLSEAKRSVHIILPWGEQEGNTGAGTN
jgi:hypothetical protein